MADLPSIRTKEQIIRDITYGLIARNPALNDFNTGSVISQFIEAVAQSQFKAYADIINMVDALSVDRAVGEALQRLAVDKNVPILPARPSTGLVNITDTSFQKISSFVYYGQPAPVAGSLVFYVVDGSKADPTGGDLYIGRGASNQEGPLTYTSITPESGGAYYKIILSSTSPTTKFHNTGEDVTFSKGGIRFIPVGTELTTAKNSASEPISFVTTAEAKIIDGETSVFNVPVISKESGKKYNVPKSAIKNVTSLSFSAAVTNPLPTSNGRDADTDDDIRQRIKDYEKAKSKGTESAIKFATIGVTDQGEQKTVSSTSIEKYSDNSAALIFDDGTGYEPLYSGAPYETVVDEAFGGEKEVQLRKRPVAQARVRCVNDSPYNMIDLSVISAEINGVQTLHQFKSEDFRVPSSATAYEIASSINSDSSINFMATTSLGGKRVVLYPKDRNENNIIVKPSLNAIDANDVLGLPVTEEVTLRLYKNDQPLRQDGVFAKVSTINKGLWLSSITSGDTLKYKVDGTPELTISFTNADFQLVDIASIMSSNTSIDIWAKVFDLKMPGVDANVNGDVIDFTSNRGASNSAKLEFTGGTLLSKIFSPTADLSKSGSAPDYTFNKQTGQIGLVTALSTGDKLTAGSQFTRANIQTRPIESGPTVNGRVWMIVDGNVEPIPNGLGANTYVSFTKSGTKLTLNAESVLSVPEGFEDAKNGDWLLVWANPTDSASLISNQGFWRIESVATGEIVVDTGSAGTTTSQFIPLTNRIQIVRSDAPIQLLDFSVGTLNNFADEIAQKLSGIVSEVVGSSVRISTKSYDAGGEIYVIAADQNGETLEFPIGQIKSNIPSHFGFVVTSDSEAGFPSFTYSSLGASSTYPEFTVSSFYELNGNNSSFIELLNKYDTSVSPKTVYDSNVLRRVFVSDYDETTNKLTLMPNKFMGVGKSVIQENDRYFIRSGYMFDPRDTLSVVADNDNFTKSFSLPVSRKIKVSTHSLPTTQDFSADDGQSSLDLNDPTSFRAFDFDGFKILRQAHKILTNGTYAIKIKANDFGKIGNKYRVGIIYPDSTSVTALSHKLSVSDCIDFGVILPVTESRTANWDFTSAFTVSKTTTNAKDSLVYTYRVGTQPDFSSGGAAVNTGDIVMIGGGTSFLAGNKNLVGKVTSVSATSFTVELPTNSSVSDNIEFLNMVNDGTQLTIKTDAAHNLSVGDRVGLWDTQSANGITYPLNTTYIVSAVLASDEFTIATPINVPGGTISNASLPANSDILTITSSTAHNLSVGNIIRINTGNTNIDGMTSVFNILSPTQFQVTRHNGNPTGYGIASGRFDFQSYKVGSSVSIDQAQKTGSLVTVTTTTNHNLSVGNIVNVQSITLDHWDSGTTYQPNQIIRNGSQNYVSIGVNSPEATITGNLANGSNEILSPSSVVGFTVGMGVSHPNIPFGTIVTSIDTITPKVVLSNAVVYPSGPPLTGVTVKFATTPPNSVGTKWNLTSLDLSGTFVVEGTPTATQFTYYYNHSGSASGTGGSASKMVSSGKLARCLNSAGNLQFGKVETTAQEIVDYISINLSEKFTASLANSNSTALINSSTQDLDILSNYLFGSISQLQKFIGSRTVKVTSSAYIESGATIKITGTTGYNGTYVVLKSEPSGSGCVFEIYTATIASANETLSVSAQFVGYQPYLMLEDGENFVESTTLDSLIGAPQFTAKKSWKEAPAIDEEMYLLACNADQLVRFWNKSVVTGLANVAKIENTEYDRQIQISTNTFGNEGSVRISGGTANSVTLALVSSTSEINDKIGLMYVPIEIRKGLVEGQWIKAQNQLRQNKIINLSSGTNIKVYVNGLEITSSVPSTGTFQTLRPTTQTANTVINIERHGDFVAISSVDGPLFNLAASGVKEGDWVRIRNTDEFAWNSSAIYSAGARVNYNGFNYTSLQNTNTNKNPETESSWWEVREFDQANEGVHQVVRTFGENTFWIKYDSAVEGIHYLGNINNIKFYSYDSVMPGDTLVVTTNVLGSQNFGRYIVQDEDISAGYYFPTSSRIYTTPIQTPSSGSIQLAGEFSQINIEEKDPIVLWKKIFTIGPASNTLASIIVDSPNLVNRLGESLGSYIEGQSKIGFNTEFNFGVDAYKFYRGLIKELNRVIYGDPSDSYNYPGVRAAGTDIDIKPATTKRVKMSLAVRIRTGTPFSQIRDKIKAIVAANINGLGTGEQVSISKCIAAAGSIKGVTSVAVTFPAYNSSNDLIPVAPSEKAIVLDPNTDIIVSLIE